MDALRSNPAEAVKPSGDTAEHAGLAPSSLARVSLLVLFIAGTVVAGYLLRASVDPFAVLRGWLKQASGAGPLLFVIVFLMLNTVNVPVPLLGAAAGAAFGPVSGAAVTLVAMTITACAQFLLARHIVGERVRQRVGQSVRANQMLERRGVIAVAGARLVPAPFSEFNMLAGLTSLKLRDFMIGTALGCVPKALVWSGLGALVFF